MSAPLQIAIDGPVAAGKGDIAMRLAKRLGFTYLYTGAMYRALALACIEKGIGTQDEKSVKDLLTTLSIELLPGIADRFYTVHLDAKDVTDRIFEPDVASLVPQVSQHAEVRKIMVDKQQNMAQGKSVVMEGRDIGKRVLPHAQLKIFLTASLEERARRRLEQFKERGIHKTFEEVQLETRTRDQQDSTRAADPLEKLPDAWELDTTNLTQDEVVEKITEELKRRNLV